EHFFVEVVQRRNDRQAPDELGDKAEADEVVWLLLSEQLAGLLLDVRADGSTKSDRSLVEAIGDDVFEAGEGASANEENVRGIDLNRLFLRIFPSDLATNVRYGAFDDFQQRLLDAFTRDVAGDRGP